MYTDLPAQGFETAGAIERQLRRLFLSSKHRARRANLEFRLKFANLRQLWHNQDGRCAVSGVRFSMEEFADVLVKRPYGPSLDRIDSQRGYIRDNVRLVCVATNFAMGEWGETVLRKIAEGVVRHAIDGLASVVATGASETAFSDWREAQLAKIAEAERQARGLVGAELNVQRRRMAGLQAVLTKGPVGLLLAGKKSAAARRTAKYVKQSQTESKALIAASEWEKAQRRRIVEAEAIAASLVGHELRRQRHRIAGLKASLAKGHNGLLAAAAKAQVTRKKGKRAGDRRS